MTFVTIIMLIGIVLMGPARANGQSKERMAPYQGSGRDPFLLPAGVRLLSKSDTASGTGGTSSKMDGKSSDALPSYRVKAILMSDHIRLALIDHHILSVGDSIYDERVLEIKTDRVVLGKGDQKRTLLLSQSPVPLTVDQRIGEKR